MHIPSREQCNWLRERIETKEAARIPPEEQLHILDRLAWSEMCASRAHPGALALWTWARADEPVGITQTSSIDESSMLHLGVNKTCFDGAGLSSIRSMLGLAETKGGKRLSE